MVRFSLPRVADSLHRVAPVLSLEGLLRVEAYLIRELDPVWIRR
jgi:hypothetical protein